MTEEKEYSITKSLPCHGQRVLCFGHKTHCCEEDMDSDPDWHKVIFKFEVSSYKLKNEISKDWNESIFEDYEVIDTWECGEDCYDGHIIGVTKWKKLNK